MDILEIIARNQANLKPIIPSHDEIQAANPNIGSGQLSRPENIRALVLDIYGTLVISGTGDISLSEDTSAGHSRLQALNDRWSLRISAHRLPSLLQEAVGKDHEQKKALGIPYPEVEILQLWRSLLADIWADPAPETPTQADLELFATDYETLVNPVSPMPGLKAFLQWIQEREFITGIISNAQFYTPFLFPAFTGKTLEEWGFLPENLTFSYRHARGKPDTWLYTHARKALENQGIHPDQVLYVGNDMLKDCWAAAQVGFQTLLFAGDKRSLRLHQSDPRTRDLVPQGIVRNLDDIVSLFQ